MMLKPGRDWVAELAVELATAEQTAAVLGSPSTLDRTLAKTAKIAKTPWSDPAEAGFGSYGSFGKASGESKELAAGQPFPALAEGFIPLDPGCQPLGFSARRWREVVQDGSAFLSTWATQANELGWTALDLFSAHKRAPEANWSAAGLILCIGGGRVIALTASTATILRPSGSRLTYTRTSPHPDAVPLWQLLEPGTNHR
jgi:hypothetical protein